MLRTLAREFSQAGKAKKRTKFAQTYGHMMLAEDDSTHTYEKLLRLVCKNLENNFNLDSGNFIQVDIFEQLHP